MQTSKDISCTCVSPEPTGLDDAVGLAKTLTSASISAEVPTTATDTASIIGPIASFTASDHGLSDINSDPSSNPVSAIEPSISYRGTASNMVADPATSSPAGTAIPLTANSAQVEAVDKVPSTHSVNAVDQACRWYIAVVNNNSEKSVRDKLTALGHTCYVATQSYVRVLRSGRRVRSEQVVIRAAVFVHCSEPERRRIVAYPFIKRFMTDRAVCAKGRPATVPEREMQTLRFILGNSDSPVSIIDRPLRRGDRVRIVRGGLRGLEGEILDTTGGDSELLIELSVLGCALLRISRLNVEAAV